VVASMVLDGDRITEPPANTPGDISAFACRRTCRTDARPRGVPPFAPSIPLVRLVLLWWPSMVYVEIVKLKRARPRRRTCRTDDGHGGGTLVRFGCCTCRR